MERVRRWLQLAGCKKIFPVSSYTGEGIAELAAFLQDDGDGKKRKAASQPTSTKKTVKKKPSAKTQKTEKKELDTWLL